MEVILSPFCKELTGTITSVCGYAIQKQGGKYVAKRNSRGAIPYWGRLAFIIHCAKLAQQRLYLADIRVTAMEFRTAIVEARKEFGFELGCRKSTDTLNAADVLYYQQMYNL